MQKKRLLLISNSVQTGSGFLDHCEAEIKDFLGDDVERVLFVPYARPNGMTHNEYADIAEERFEKMGFGLDSIHEFKDPARAVREAEAIFVGGGNTFVLLEDLQRRGIMSEIRKKVNKGIPYIGSSAGSNVAGPSIMTTNDMPIREIKSLKALGFVPFQINPHYLDPDPKPKINVESREIRIKEFHEFNDLPVVGIREGTYIRIEGNDHKLKGRTGAVVFRKGKKPRELKINSSLNFLCE